MKFDHEILNLFIFTIFSFAIKLSASIQSPNIIIFVADDLGWDDVGFHGSLQVSTPNIDSLAADGVILNNFYASPVCSPSRGALLTAIHPIHSATQNYVILTASPWGLPLELKLLPQHLKSFNYSTHLVGKWHLGFYKKEYTPTYRGFDSHVGFWSGSGDYFDHTTIGDGGLWGIDFRHNLDMITNASGIYSAHYFTSRAIDLIDKHNKSQPLFLQVSYQNVHGANTYARIQAPQEYVNKFDYIKSLDRRMFAANLYTMDESIGFIFDKLNECDMLQNSIIVFMSDNGGPASGFTGNAASNWPLRGVKATLWEGGIRVPAFIWSPLMAQSRYVSNALMHVTDIMPTLLQAIQTKDAKTKPLKMKDLIYGKPMWEVICNNLVSPRVQLLHNIDPIWNVSAIRQGRWKLIQGLVFPKWTEWYPPFSQNDTNQSFIIKERYSSRVYKSLSSMGRSPDYKLFMKAALKCKQIPSNASRNCDLNMELCLFDIEDDPCEYNNIASQHPGIVDQLWKRIVDLNKTSVTPGTQPTDSNADPRLHQYSWTNWKDSNC